MSTLNTTNLKNESSVTNNVVLGSDGSVDLDSGTLYVDAANDRVGVGTTSPSELVQLYRASGSCNLRVTSGASSANFAQNGVDTYLTNGANGPIQFWTNGAERARIDSSGRLLVGTSTVPGDASGDTVVGVGSKGLVVTKSNDSVANNGTVDIQVGTSGGRGYQGFLIVTNTEVANAGSRTHTTYSVFGRGTDSSIQQIATDNGASGGRTFTVTTPSNGVLRVTNTSGFTTAVAVQFFGGTSL